VPLVVGRPDVPPPANVGIARLETGPQPWGSDGGGSPSRWSAIPVAARRVSARLGTRSAAPGARARRRRAVLAMPGYPAAGGGADAELDPDELRLDDRRVGVVRVAAGGPG